jgi:hypothetical protein
MVDDGGQITRRHAYYMGTDGARMQAAYVSTAPVRCIMEFDNVVEQFNSVALVSGSEQIKNVPISASGAKSTIDRRIDKCAARKLRPAHFFVQTKNPPGHTICTRSGGQSRKFSMEMFLSDFSASSAGTIPKARLRPSRFAR